MRSSMVRCRLLVWPRLLVWTLTVAVSASAAADEPPLHERIDALIDAAAAGPINPQSSDADFLRRASLDLTGVIPTAAQARAFFDDPATDKRPRLIEQLLASPRYARHMALSWDVMLLERRSDKTMKVSDWEEYLQKSFSENKPLDQLFRELLTSDGADEALRPAARFMLNRDCEPNAVTRDIGRMFFGMDMQCAQCHDHPLIEDYFQADYYGLFAFVLRSSLFNDRKTKLALVAEKAEGEADFKSVFTSASADNVTPRLPKGVALTGEPTFAKGEAYLVPPAANVRPVPKHSRRAELATLLDESHEFRRNLANRLWAHLFGRGLVHPLDFHHPANPPSHPELLTLLADELARSKFDAKRMLRELALTRAYQRSCDAPLPTSLSLPTAADEIVRWELRRPELAAKEEALKAASDKVRDQRKTFLAQLESQQKEVTALEATAKTSGEAAEKALAEQKAADESLAKVKEQSQLVTNAALRTSVAVKKIPGDKVVEQAFALLDGRAKALAIEAETATKAAAELVAKNGPILEQAKSDQAAVAASRAKLPLQELTRHERAVLDAQHKLADARYAIAALDSQLATAQAIGQWQAALSDPAQAEPAWDSVLDRWTVAGQVGRLRPLSCEQFTRGLMQATGVLNRQDEAARAALEKKPPAELTKAAETERAGVLARLVEQRAFDALRKDLATFVNLYGALPGDDFQATVNQALFFGNGSQVQDYLKPSDNNLADRLTKMEDPAALADELYLSVLTRLPTQDEKDDLAAYLQPRPDDRSAAIGELLWALVSSNEFRFNH
ncbi:MAG: DUF1549 domain-containing protein [Pirellulaceae bacterium]